MERCLAPLVPVFPFEQAGVEIVEIAYTQIVAATAEKTLEVLVCGANELWCVFSIEASARLRRLAPERAG